MNKLFYSLGVAALVVLTASFLATPLLAADNLSTGDKLDNIGDRLENFSGKSGVGFDSATIDEYSIFVLIGTYVEYAMAFVGLVLGIIIVYAAYLWLTAGGNEDQVTKAKSLLRNAIIGLVIVFAAAIITQYITVALLSGSDYDVFIGM